MDKVEFFEELNRWCDKWIYNRLLIGVIDEFVNTRPTVTHFDFLCNPEFLEEVKDMVNANYMEFFPDDRFNYKKIDFRFKLDHNLYEPIYKPRAMWLNKKSGKIDFKGSVVIEKNTN